MPSPGSCSLRVPGERQDQFRSIDLMPSEVATSDVAIRRFAARAIGLPKGKERRRSIWVS
jgi:hypothetical protein